MPEQDFLSTGSPEGPERKSVFFFRNFLFGRGHEGTGFVFIIRLCSGRCRSRIDEKLVERTSISGAGLASAHSGLRFLPAVVHQQITVPNTVGFQLQVQPISGRVTLFRQITKTHGHKWRGRQRRLRSVF